MLDDGGRIVEELALAFLSELHQGHDEAEDDHTNGELFRPTESSRGIRANGRIASGKDFSRFHGSGSRDSDSGNEDITTSEACDVNHITNNVSDCPWTRCEPPITGSEVAGPHGHMG